jgi:adenylate kinase family enzyme
VQRVAVVGSGGAGKSALARQIGAITGLPVIHLDHHYWSPGWIPMPDDEWEVHQRELLAGPCWVADGNYGGTLELRAELADTVVFLDLPRRVCLSRVMRRIRSPVLQAPGCPQKVDLEFLRWVWSFPNKTRPRVLEVLARHAPTTEVVFLRSGADIRGFLARIRAASALRS